MSISDWIFFFALYGAVVGVFLQFVLAHRPSSEGHELRQNLYPIAAFVALLSLHLVWAIQLTPTKGWDFTGFYTAGNVPLRSLYDRAVFVEFGKTHLAPFG